MSLTKPNSGDPGYSGATKASTVIGAMVDAINHLTFDVKSYGGATGDGTTDDTTAVSNTITAAATNGGGIVFFPQGTYKLTSALTKPANVHLLGVGSGSNLNFTGLGAGVFALTCDGCVADTIDRIQITTNRSGVKFAATSSNTISNVIGPGVRLVGPGVATAGEVGVLIDTPSGALGNYYNRIEPAIIDGFETNCKTNSGANATVFGATWHGNFNFGLILDSSENHILGPFFSSGGSNPVAVTVKTTRTMNVGMFTAEPATGSYSLKLEASTRRNQFIIGDNSVNGISNLGDSTNTIIASSRGLVGWVAGGYETVGGVSNYTPDINAGNTHRVSANANLTINAPSNSGSRELKGAYLTIIIKNGTAGAITVTWDATGAGYYVDAGFVPPAAGQSKTVTFVGGDASTPARRWIQVGSSPDINMG